MTEPVNAASLAARDDIDDIESAIARAEAEAATLKARREAAIAAERPKALATVLALIAKHGFTKAEFDSALRKRAFVPKPRKAKPSVPSLVMPSGGGPVSGTAASPLSTRVVEAA